MSPRVVGSRRPARPNDALCSGLDARGQQITYRVTWSDEDGEFLATRAEFPSLSWLASLQFEEMQRLEDRVRDVIADTEGQGEPVPQPVRPAQRTVAC